MTKTNQNKKENLFPHSEFNWRLEVDDKKDKKVCWFQSEAHVQKFITKHHLKKNDYVLLTNVNE